MVKRFGSYYCIRTERVSVAFLNVRAAVLYMLTSVSLSLPIISFCGAQFCEDPTGGMWCACERRES